MRSIALRWNGMGKSPEKWLNYGQIRPGLKNRRGAFFALGQLFPIQLSLCRCARTSL
jgi:hypothetical protein